MADLREKILDKYEIDITKENVLKLYKVDNADISDQELETRISETRKRWNQSINGANEKNAERDRTRLEKADKYETILRDRKLREELADYYAGGGKSSRKSGDTGVPSGSVDFAREYFKLVQTTKKLNRQDVEFFFDYYQGQRKNKKAICEMLEKEFKMRGLKDKEEGNEKDAADQEGKKKDDSSVLVVNLFQKETILKLRKCNDWYEDVRQNREICQKYPALREGLYEFLDLKEIKALQQFKQMVETRGKEIYAIRQEKGRDYVPLVDLFNTLQTLSQYQDVADNYSEFCLLIRYPNLSPYMFAFSEMEKNTLREFETVAARDYVFRNEDDFLLSYYIPLRKHFGVKDSKITSIVNKAAKKARKNKALDALDEKLGRKKKAELPLGAKIIYGLAYWPIFLLYLILEILRGVFWLVNKAKFVVVIAVFLAIDAWIAQRFSAWSHGEWYSFGQTLIYLLSSDGRKILMETKGIGSESVKGFILNISTLFLMMGGMAAAPTLVIKSIIYDVVAAEFNPIDWIGVQRTFQNMFAELREQAAIQYQQYRKRYFRKKISQMIGNICCVIVLSVAVFLGAKAVRTADNKVQDAKETLEAEFSASAETDTVAAGESAESEEEPEVLLQVTANSANVRTGPGTDYEAFTTISGGETYVATGNEAVASNGSTWYEIYLDEEKTETGWASEKVITPME